MSIDAITAVWKHSQQNGTRLLMMLAIADYTQEGGKGAYPGIETLANKARLSDTMTRTIIKELIEAGELITYQGKISKDGQRSFTTPMYDIAPRIMQGKTNGPVKKTRPKNGEGKGWKMAEEIRVSNETDEQGNTGFHQKEIRVSSEGNTGFAYTLSYPSSNPSISAANNAAPTQATLDLKGDETIGVDDPQPQPKPETPKPNNLLHFKEKEGLSLTDDNPTQTPPPVPSTPSPSSAEMFDALERAAPVARQKVSYGKGDVQDYYALLVKLNTGGWTVEQFNASKSAKVTGRFGKAAKRLRAKGCDLNIMADQYGAPEGFWWSTYWKGVKEKQYPEPEDIEDTWNDWLKVTAPTTKHATTPDAQPQVVPPSVLPRHRPEDDKEYADPAEVADMARQAKAILAEKIAEREARQALRRTA